MDSVHIELSYRASCVRICLLYAISQQNSSHSIPGLTSPQTFCPPHPRRYCYPLRGLLLLLLLQNGLSRGAHLVARLQPAFRSLLTILFHLSVMISHYLRPSFNLAQSKIEAYFLADP